MIRPKKNRLSEDQHFQQKELQDGLKYLGFFLKPNAYNLVDWLWLVKKVEERIIIWVYHLLSRGGHLIFIKSIIESILIFWLTIVQIPKGILNKIMKFNYRYLWVGNLSLEGIPLVKWYLITKPKLLGGWGLKNCTLFGSIIATKSLWRMLKNKELWGRALMEEIL